MNIIISLLIFGLIVLIHEFGHFIFAKKAGITVIEFSVGMGPRIFSVQGKETRYSLKLLPLGGSCMMLGEDEEEETNPGSFNSKSPLARFLVIAAGPLFNFILSFIVSIFIVSAIGVDKPVISDVMEGYPAAEAGMLPGDEVLAINNHKIDFYREISMYFALNQGRETDLRIRRQSDQGPQILDFHIRPKFSEEYQSYMAGIVSSGTTKIKNPFAVMGYAAKEVAYSIESTLTGLRLIISGRIGAGEISGPVGIVNIIGRTVEESKTEGILIMLLSVGGLVVVLSSNLGVMNLLPLPALDGGRILFILAEAIRRKPLNRRLEGMIHLTGFALLMVLMVFLLFNDVKNILFR
ncbi:MAG: RIP metalloprotease RseP [Johnsonella sp.]|nr:RIP metalloprotease RseP [Johnsonella sp.]